MPIWSGDIDISPLPGGMTNLNFVVTDTSGKYVVRVGNDIPVHHVLRFNELSASQAAAKAALSPAVVYHEDGMIVLDYIDGRTLTEADLRDEAMLPRALELVKRCHQEVPKHLRGPALAFWVFHVIRDYAATLSAHASPHAALTSEFLDYCATLEKASGPHDIVFGHNDLLCGNFLDDGSKLWLIDYDYAGFNSPLFDLGGLASNNGLSPDQEVWMLESYFDRKLTPELLHRYSAMKCASLLRETLWSMVSEVTSEIEFDYSEYTTENLARYRAAWSDFQNS